MPETYRAKNTQKKITLLHQVGISNYLILKLFFPDTPVIADFKVLMWLDVQTSGYVRLNLVFIEADKKAQFIFPAACL